MSSISKLRLERAYSRVKGVVTKTPLISGTFLDELWDAEVYLKCEQFQPIGAFKLRGASNFSLQLSEAELERGLITHSSGNHAQAIAYMAHKLGVKANVVMPENANKRKIESAKKWGAEVVHCEPTIEARIAVADNIKQQTGGTVISPFDHEWIVEGQATCAMEMIAEHSDFDILVAPLGGGGLLAGTALAAHYFSSRAKVIGAEPENAADGYEGFISGNRVKSSTPDTVADGLRTTVGEVPFPIIREHVSDVWLAKEEAVLPWMYRIWEEYKMIIEPSSAVPFAALDSQRDRIRGKKIGIIITGGNVDLKSISKQD